VIESNLRQEMEHTMETLKIVLANNQEQINTNTKIMLAEMQEKIYDNQAKADADRKMYQDMLAKIV
jgi:hypothetical protein